MKQKVSLSWLICFIFALFAGGCGGQMEVIETGSDLEGLALQTDLEVAEAFSRALNEVGHTVEVQTLQEVEGQLIPEEAPVQYNILSIAEANPAGLSTALDIPEPDVIVAGDRTLLDVIQAAQDNNLLTEDQQRFLIAQRLSIDFIDYDAIVANALNVSATDMDDLRASGGAIMDFLEEQGFEPDVVYPQIREEVIRQIEGEADRLGIDIGDISDLVTCLGGFESLGNSTPGNVLPPEIITPVEDIYGTQLLYTGPCVGTPEISLDEANPDDCLVCERVTSPGKGPITVSVGPPSSMGVAPSLIRSTGGGTVCPATPTVRPTPVGSAIKLDPKSERYEIDRASKMKSCTQSGYPKTEIEVLDGRYNTLIFYIENGNTCGRQFPEHVFETIRDIEQGQIVIYCGDPTAIDGKPDAGYELTTLPAQVP